MSAMLDTLSPEARARLRAYHQRRLADKEAKLVLAEQELDGADQTSRWKRMANITKLKTAIAELKAVLADS